MLLLCFSDVTLITESGTSLIGPGETVNLPAPDALKVMGEASAHFKILAPTPLLPGVAVCWSLSDDRVQGPGIVAQIVGDSSPDRRLSVSIDEAQYWIAERDIVDINPWPAIDAKLEDAWPYLLVDGDESPKVQEVRAWLATHFDDDSFDM